MVLKNYLYNLMYQVVTILVPIITIPYISRVLGAEGLGKYSLTNTYAQYFVLFGMIGLSVYCSREIACVKDDKEDLSRAFWEFNFIRFITMGISLILYIIIFIFIIDDKNKMINIIQSTILISSLLDISWFFIGLEDFKKVAIRNTIVKLVGTIFVFFLVKDSSQVWLYALILGGSQLLGQIIMWFDIPREIKFVLPKKKNLIRHFIFASRLFIPQIAINIYTMFDKVMLGAFTNESQVGMYDNSQKIIKILITIVTTLGVVTIPKMTNLYKSGKIDEFREISYKSFSFVCFLSFPMAFGLIGICKKFVPWFYGPGFEEVIPMFYVGSWLMIILAWSSIVGNQVLLSTKRDNKFTIAVSIGASVNVILNLVLIKHFQGVGTTISSVIAELTVTLFMVYYVRDILDIRSMLKSVPKYLISSFIMFIFVLYVGRFVRDNVIGNIIQVIVGGIIYLLIMGLTRDKNLVYAFSFLKNKFKDRMELE